MNTIIEQGNQLLKESKFEEARILAEQYIAELHTSPKDALTLFEAMNVLAFSYIRRSLAKDAIPIIRKMLELCPQLPDEIRSKREFRCYNILGLLNFELTQHKEALQLLEKAHEIALELNDKDIMSTITGNLGLIHSEMSNDVQALELLRFSEQLSIELQTNDHLAILCDNLATIFSKHGDYPSALEYYTKALDLHTKAEAIDGIGRALGHIGTVYFTMNEIEKGKQYLYEALAIHESIDYKRGIETWNEVLGDIMMKCDNPDEALKHYTRAIEINKELGNRGTEAVHIGSIGDVHVHKGNLEEAYQCYETALSILSEYDRMGDYYDITLELSKILSNEDFSKYDPEKAEQIMMQSLDILRTHSLKSIEKEYLLALSNLHKKLGNWELAYSYYVESIQIKEELYSNDVRNTIKDMEFQKAYHKMEEKRLIEVTKLQEKEQLLHEILPSHIADKIIQGQHTIAEECQDMTIMFADIVGFTSISEDLPPSDIIELLNDVYSKLDSLADAYGIEKIKTIGDAYMAICNSGESIGEHRKRMLLFAKEVIATCSGIILPNGNSMEIRIGIHSGPTVTGVIGTKKLSYDVWGDAVNTAARMESYGEPGTIQVTMEFYEALNDSDIFGSFEIVTEKELIIKGKGLMKTVILR